MLNDLEINHHNHQSVLKLIDELFTSYSKVMVVRVDLSYLKIAMEGVSPQLIKQQISAMLTNNSRHNALFEHLITYAWCLEYGTERQWHAHLFLFFDGQKVCRDIHYSLEVCRYWENIMTQGVGTGFSCNAKQDQYNTNSLGMINRNDTDKIQALKEATKYICKQDLNIEQGQWRDQGGKKIRTMFIGRL